MSNRVIAITAFYTYEVMFIYVAMKENSNWWVAAGMGCILAGVWISERKKK